MIDSQQNIKWLDAFYAWFDQHKTALSHVSIVVEMPPEIRGSGTYADLKNEWYEATVQLWNNGLSDFHVMDWKAADRDPGYQGEVTHYEFRDQDELSAALGTLVKRMSESDELPFILDNRPLSGYSETTYIETSRGKISPITAAKGKFK